MLRLDVSNWQYDNVVTAKLFNNSTVVKSISNSFLTSVILKSTLKMYTKSLKMELTMTMLSKRLVHLDVYSIAVSSDATMTQALWSSNLVAKKGIKQVAYLNFKNGALENKSQTNLINK